MSEFFDTEIGRIHKDWDYSELENYFDLITYGFTNPMPDSTEGPYKITAKDIHGGKIQFSTARKTTDDAYENLITDKSRPLPNDILITKDGSIGRLAIVDNRKICISQSVAVIRPNSKIIPLYLKYLLESPKYQQIISRDATGSVMKHIYITKINKMKIGVPNLKVQESIVEAIDSIQSKIDLLHRQNQTLEQMAETIFRQSFVDVAKDSWASKILEDLCEIRNGHAFKSKDYRNSGHVIVRTKDFDNGYVSIANPVFLAEELINNYDKFQLSRKELLLVMVGASLGKTVIVTGDILPALQNQNMWAFKALNKLHQFYLNYVVKELVKENLYIASGSARSFFQKGSFYKFSVSLPPEELLIEANIHFEQFFNKIELNRSQIKSLEGLRDTLLPKLMSGEVRVSEL